MTSGSWAGTWIPKSRISPLVGRVSPSSILIVLVLPEPFGPRNPCTPPGGDVEVETVDGHHTSRA